MPTTKKFYEYQMFVEWIATPDKLRCPATQKTLAKKLGVDAATLSDWKKDDNFWIEVSKQLKLWGRGKTPDVLQALYHNVIATGNPNAVKLWLDTFDSEYLVQDVKQDPVGALLDAYGVTSALLKATGGSQDEETA